MTHLPGKETQISNTWITIVSWRVNSVVNSWFGLRDNTLDQAQGKVIVYIKILVFCWRIEPDFLPLTESDFLLCSGHNSCSHQRAGRRVTSITSNLGSPLYNPPKNTPTYDLNPQSASLVPRQYEINTYCNFLHHWGFVLSKVSTPTLQMHNEAFRKSQCRRYCSSKCQPGISLPETMLMVQLEDDGRGL